MPAFYSSTKSKVLINRMISKYPVIVLVVENEKINRSNGETSRKQSDEKSDKYDKINWSRKKCIQNILTEKIRTNQILPMKKSIDCWNCRIEKSPKFGRRNLQAGRRKIFCYHQYHSQVLSNLSSSISFSFFVKFFSQLLESACPSVHSEQNVSSIKDH